MNAGDITSAVLVKKPAWQTRCNGQLAKGGVTVCEGRRGVELAVRVRHESDTILGTLVINHRKCYVLAITDDEKFVKKMQYEVLCNARESWEETRSDRPIPDDALVAGRSAELGLLYYGRVQAFGTVVAGQVSSKTRRCYMYHRNKDSTLVRYDFHKYEIMLAPQEVRDALTSICDLPDTSLLEKTENKNQKRQRGQRRIKNKEANESEPNAMPKKPEYGQKKIRDPSTATQNLPLPKFQPIKTENLFAEQVSTSYDIIPSPPIRREKLVGNLSRLSFKNDDGNSDPVVTQFRGKEILSGISSKTDNEPTAAAPLYRSSGLQSLVGKSSLEIKPQKNDNSTPTKQSSSTNSKLQVDSNVVKNSMTVDKNSSVSGVELAQEVTAADDANSKSSQKLEPETQKKCAGVASTEWVSTSGGGLPPGAVHGGNSALPGNKPCYVVRAEHKSAIIPGFLQFGDKKCTITSGGVEVNKSDFEVLCDSWTKWTLLRLGDSIPDQAIIGGLSDNSDFLFIGRVRLPNKLITIGKVDPQTLRCYILHEGTEHGYSNFEILVRATLFNVCINKLSNFLFNKPAPSTITSIVKPSPTTVPRVSTSNQSSSYYRNSTPVLPASYAQSSSSWHTHAPSGTTYTSAYNNRPHQNVLTPTRTALRTTRTTALPARATITPSNRTSQQYHEPERKNSERKEDEFRMEVLDGMQNKSFRFVFHRMQNTIVQHSGNRGGVFDKYEIVKMERIWNSAAHRRYLQHRRVVADENGGDANEMQLFHGSPICKHIAQKGFDERHASTSGMFGAGIYFAEHSSKSNQYVWGGGCAIHADTGCALCERHMLLCRVTLGKISIHQTSQRFSHAPPGHHSVKGEPSSFGLVYPEYIIYRGEQAFPEYLITYKIKLTQPSFSSW